jgi:type II secretory pathway component PulF
MATFTYEALTATGRLMEGTLEACSSQEAGQLLDQMHLKVNSLQEAPPARPKGLVGRNEFLLFNQQLASITKAGIPLERGLRELATDIASPKMRRLVGEIAGDLEAGQSIEQAFEKRQKQFPPLYSRILRAGVQTGRLSEMLTHLNRHLELSGQTRRIIFEALAYPAVVLAFGAVVLTGVFMFVIPQFRSILQDMMGGSLPAVTQFVLFLSAHVIPFWAIVGSVVAAVVLTLAACASSPAGRRFRESLLSGVPVMGRVWHAGTMSRFSEAMATLVAAGCDMPTCLRLAADAASSERLALEAGNLATQVEQGRPILEAGQFCRMIPRLFLYSVQLGIQRNELQDNLHGLADMYANQARHNQGRLQAVLLPVMLIVIGGVVATAVLAMFLPMIQVVTSLSGSGG